jgi:hypothetical protein
MLESYCPANTSLADITRGVVNRCFLDTLTDPFLLLVALIAGKCRQLPDCFCVSVRTHIFPSPPPENYIFPRSAKRQYLFLTDLYAFIFPFCNYFTTTFLSVFSVSSIFSYLSFCIPLAYFFFFPPNDIGSFFPPHGGGIFQYA